MKRISKGRSDRGSVLLESLSFATMAFVLILSSGLFLFEQQIEYLELQTLARNVLRTNQIHPEISYGQALAIFQNESEFFKDRQLQLHYSCKPDCKTQNSLIQLVLASDSQQVEVFGVGN